jgi:hypothetical protein
MSQRSIHCLKSLFIISLLYLLLPYNVNNIAYATCGGGECSGPGAAAKIDETTIKAQYNLGENITFKLVNAVLNYKDYKIQFECDCDPNIDGNYTDVTNNFIIPKQNTSTPEFNPPFSINDSCHCFVELHDANNNPTFCDSCFYTKVGSPSQIKPHPDHGLPFFSSISSSCQSEFYISGNDDPAGDGVSTVFGCIPIQVKKIIVWLLKYLIPPAGGIAFLIILIGVFTHMTSTGNPEKIAKGQQIITSAVMGLLFIIFGIFLLHLIGVQIIRIPGLAY